MSKKKPIVIKLTKVKKHSLVFEIAASTRPTIFVSKKTYNRAKEKQKDKNLE